ncbi:hypothetical protein HYH02_014455 [Chlamydomonas schloesseri]|uniref:Uncharacterized protein n=1 Tax=Chlamydomonas schloesseri TaxID=2026947 RepID=A0A835SJ60_9CHLO|nr:hypothetical protein HYH02_014455 [Chlamydomonas schloesseri]|eukprot:KAG2428108.1 hypothetical protein HYH02_014455 [Chlamydomonas schloesseri]
MVTKAEAAAAVRAKTAPGKERARLLNWLDEQTDDQLHQWLIQAEDGHETIVECIKQKADPSAAGLGVGSAARAGSLPAAGGGGDGCSVEAARMMQALRKMSVLPGPGEVLKATSFHLHPDNDALFVRECYPRLFEALVCKPLPRLYIVTGTPGVGKSWFFYYMVARLLKSTRPPPFIVWEHLTVPNMAWCYKHKTGEVSFRKRSSFGGELNDDATWYISDGVPPQLNCRARTVLLTSPKRKTFKEMRKASARMLYMPLWKLDELLVCRRLLYKTVDEPLAEELYEHYGGVARSVLQLPKANPGEGLDTLLTDLHEAVAECDTAAMRQSVGSISRGPDVCHRLLHIVADEHFKKLYLVFASKWVAKEFAKKAVRDELQGLVSLLASTSGALKGMLYEATMHAVLSKGGRFTAAPISYDTGSLERGAEEDLVLAPCTEQEFFKALSDTATVETYYRPSSATFPTVDAFKRSQDTCDLFQMTVASSKTLDAKTLSNLVDELKLRQGVTPRLLFVVHEDSYPTFKLAAGKNWPPKPKQAASRVKLYVVKGVYDQPQTGTKRGAKTHLAGVALKRARTNPTPPPSPPTTQQERKLAGVAPDRVVRAVAGAGADSAQPATGDAAMKAAAAKDKDTQQAKEEKEEAKLKEKGKGKGTPAQAADCAATSGGVATPTTEPEYREAIVAMIRGQKGPVQLSVLGSVVKRPAAVGGKLKAYLESHPDLFAVTPAGVTLKSPPAKAAAQKTRNEGAAGAGLGQVAEGVRRRVIRWAQRQRRQTEGRASGLRRRRALRPRRVHAEPATNNTAQACAAAQQRFRLLCNAVAHSGDKRQTYCRRTARTRWFRAAPASAGAGAGDDEGEVAAGVGWQRAWGGGGGGDSWAAAARRW